MTIRCSKWGCSGVCAGDRGRGPLHLDQAHPGSDGPGHSNTGGSSQVCAHVYIYVSR